jgi:hypothetical protein
MILRLFIFSRRHAKKLEWFQWLVEQLERHSVTKTNLQVGAQTVYRDWQP